MAQAAQCTAVTEIVKSKASTSEEGRSPSK